MGVVDEAHSYAARLKAWILREVARDRGGTTADLSTAIITSAETIALTVALGLPLPEDIDVDAGDETAADEGPWDDDRATPAVMPSEYAQALDEQLRPHERVTVPTPHQKKRIR